MPLASQQQKKVKKERMNTVGIDVGKRKCRAAIKDRSGQTLNEFFFSNDKDGINKQTNQDCFRLWKM